MTQARLALILPSGKVTDLPPPRPLRTAAPFVLLQALGLWIAFALSARLPPEPWSDLLFFLEVYLVFVLVSTLGLMPITVLLSRRASPAAAGGGEKK